MLFCIFSCRKIHVYAASDSLRLKVNDIPVTPFFYYYISLAQRKTATSKNMHPLPQKMSLHVGVATSDVVDTNLAPAGSRLPRTRS